MQIKLGPNSIRILRYILHYQDRHGYPPSLLEISRRLHFKSHHTARYHVDRIIRAGILKRVQRISRGLEIVDMSRALRIINRSEN